MHPFRLSISLSLKSIFPLKGNNPCPNSTRDSSRMGTTRSTIIKMLIVSSASAAAILLLLDLATTTFGSGGCDSSFPAPIAGASELDSAFRELISLGWLAAGDRTVCVGPDSVAAAVIARQIGLPAAIAAPATACCALPFDGESFDFAVSAALDRARVPARVLLEMERVLRPGRVGAIFRLRHGPSSGLGSGRTEGLMRLAAPVASLLRFSDVIGARAVNGSSMVVFRKRRGRSGAPVMERVTIMPQNLGDAIMLVRTAVTVGIGRFGIIDLFRD